MIKINVKKENDVIKYIKISGHAEYAEEGYDIVCASVSSITITTVNALISIDEDCIVYSEADGLLEIGIMKHSDIIDKLVNNMLELLEALSHDYKDYIKII
jgi:hypothetical protein